MTTKDVTVDGNLTNNTAPAIADRLLLIDDGTDTLQDITPDVLLKVINGLTEDTAPTRSADFVATYSTSGTAAKKVLLNNLGAYTLQVAQVSHDPADSTIYYWGSHFSGGASSTADIRRVYIPRAGVITKFYGLIVVAGTLGTTEDVTLAIRLNDTSDITVSSTIKLNALKVPVNNTALSISVAAGNYIEMKISHPAYVTNPTTVYYTGTVFIE